MSKKYLRRLKMSKKIKKLLVVLMACVLVIPVLPVTEVKADYMPTLNKNMTLVYYQKEKWLNDTYVALPLNVKDTDKVTLSKVKLSNSKVLKVKVEKFGDAHHYLVLTTKKAGTSEISLDAKVNGKTHKIKCVVKVIKYKNPLKSLKIGSKNYASKFKNSESPTWSSSGTDKIKGKLNIVPNKGWKISKIVVRNTSTGKGKVIKNKTNIDMSKAGVDVLEITVKNSKTGLKHTICIWR